MLELATECDLARSPLLARFSALARELRVVLPVSFVERSHTALFNSVAVIMIYNNNNTFFDMNAVHTSDAIQMRRLDD
jgi:hypothetical protein